MRKSFVILVLFTSFCFHSMGQEVRVFESLGMYSKILKQEVKFSICLPEGYKKSAKRYPVVYMLHGLGDNESSWLEYGRVNQVTDKAVKEGEIIPMIYVMPQGFRTYYVNDFAGSFLYQDMFVKELIPFIDSVYRTIADKKSRATIGYSMGGFGALVLPLKYPDLFSVCVPMSISIRTDSQYMEEDANGWDDQWGRIFGAVGEKGKARMTDYYLQNSPLPMVALQDKNQWNDLKIYIDNGDDEETLASSNETLHQLLLERKIPHEFRVRNGGHEFAYWRQSLHNGLRFVSDHFQGKPYRGDAEPVMVAAKQATNQLLKTVAVSSKNYHAYFPKEYTATNRLYPVIYVVGAGSATQQATLANIANDQINKNLLPPFLMLFIPAEQEATAEGLMKEFEKKNRVRPGYRFRSLLLMGNAGNAMKYALQKEQFTACAMIDVSMDFKMIQQKIDSSNVKALERTWYFFSSTDKSSNSKANGDLHMLMKKKDIYHEYRVAESSKKPNHQNALMLEVFQFIARKMHR